MPRTSTAFRFLDPITAPMPVRPAERAYFPSDMTQAMRESFSPAGPIPATIASRWVSSSNRPSVSKKPFLQSFSAERISTWSFSIQT